MRSFIGASVNGKPTVSKTVTAGSSPAAPVGLARTEQEKKVMGIFTKPLNFLKEVRQELTKVSWSSRQEVMSLTVVVIVTTSLIAVFIGIIDVLLSKVLSMIFS